jgi:hypothetical protein
MALELEDDWHPSVKLNAIGRAIDRHAADPIPDAVSRDEIEEICYTIAELYGGFIEELGTETALSTREAQTWVLRNLVYPGAEPLAYEAIGLYIWAIGRAREGDPLSRTIVTDYYGRAAEKVERAEATLMRAGAPPYADSLFDEPAVLWVDGAINERLRNRLGENETYSALLERLLEETSDAVSLQALVEAYVEHRASAYVGIETVYPAWDETLRVVAHSAEEGQLPDGVAAPERVAVAGTVRSARLSERESPPTTDSQVVVYREGAEPVDIATGLAAVERALEFAAATPAAVVDRLRATGGLALAIERTPTGAGAHLHVVCSAAAPPVNESLAGLDRVELDDRSIDVSQLSEHRQSVATALSEELRWLWVDSAAAGLEPLSLPNDLAAQRERFPRAVLWTD